MSERFEYNIAGDDRHDYMHSTTWRAQTFTPSVAHKILSVKLLLYRIGSPGDLTIGIRETSGGKPTGGDLCSGSRSANSFTEDTGGLWYEITLGAGFDLEADKQYAIVGRALDGSLNNQVEWRLSGDDTYDGGQWWTSTDSGVGWIDWAFTRDFMFEEWGDEIIAAVGRSFGFIFG